MTDDSQPPSTEPPRSGPQYGSGPQPGPRWGQPPPYGQPSQYGPPPQYGQYGQQTQFPPRISTKIKPTLWWLAAAWGVFAVCVVAGVAMFGGGILGAVPAMAPTRTFAPGESITVPIDPAQKPAVYVSSHARISYDCSISGGPAQARLAKVAGTQTVTAGDTVWQEILVINAPAKGDYQLTCTNQEQAAVRYGVGRDLLSGMGGIAGDLLKVLLVPAAGLLAAITGTVVVLVRRSRARRRLADSG